MSYGGCGYGSLPYGGCLGGSVQETPPSEVSYKRYVVGARATLLVVRRQEDAIVRKENRIVRAMPSAIVSQTTFVKDPEALVPYGVDWSEVLDSGETIINSGWAGNGLSLSNATISGPRCTVRIGGGTLNNLYLVENSIQTSLGRSYTRGFLISIERT